MKDNGRCTFEAALNIWSEALGGEPGKASGHNLGFSEVTHLGKTQYCYKPGTTELNQKVPDDALVIMWREAEQAGGVSFGTVGYRSEVINKGFFRHTLQMSSNAPASTIAHEVSKASHIRNKANERTDWT